MQHFNFVRFIRYRLNLGFNRSPFMNFGSVIHIRNKVVKKNCKAKSILVEVMLGFI